MITPAPGGRELTVPLECTVRPSDDIGETHLVTISPDWTVTTPHDLTTERVARAMGSWSSCLHFVETTVPAYRHALAVMHQPRLLGRDRWGMWVNTSRGPCADPLHAHAALRDAVRHEISAEHLGARFESREWRLAGVATAAWSQYFQLMWAAREVWARSANPDVVDFGFHGYLRLWRDGLLPEQAERIAARLPGVTFPLPAEYYVHAHYGSAERQPIR